MDEYNTQEKIWIWEKVEKALEKLCEQDTFLLENNVNERSISHKLATYLQEVFEEWDVDCEYNRDHHNPDLIKRLVRFIGSGRTDDEHARTVFPDIIVHHRGKRENLLVIEIKKSTNRDWDGELDKEKLTAYKGQELGYRYALFLTFYTGRDFYNHEKCEKCYKEEFI